MATAALNRPFPELIVGQRNVRERLAQSLRSGRAAHSYLLTGPSGAGKVAVALEYAMLLLCERDGNAPCGECPQCIISRKLQHPDLHLVLPLPPAPRADMSLDDEAAHFADRISRTLEALADDPYASLTPTSSRRGKGDSEKRERTQRLSIRISWIRGIVQAASRKPYQAKRRVFAILDADTMNANAQNALLKCLEEPFENSFFLLVTGKERELLPTIRSRCQILRMQPLTTDEIVDALEATGTDSETAHSAALLSAGDFAYARMLSHSDLAATEDRVVSFLRAAAVCNPLDLPGECEAVSGEDGTNDTTFLGLLARFLRDIALTRATMDTRETPALAFRKSEEVIRNLLRAYPAANFELMARWVDQAAQRLELGYTRDYVLFALTIRLNSALGSRVVSKTAVRHVRSA